MSMIRAIAKLSMLAAANLTVVLAVQAANPQVLHATIDTKGVGPYFLLDIPVRIYPGSLHPDLHDLRVRNAEGVFLPFAWTDIATTNAQLESNAISAFPLKDIQSSSFSSFRQNRDGTLTPLSNWQISKHNPVPAWILDVSRVKGRLLQAKFKIADKADGTFAFTLESSDDLKNWQSLSSEQLVQLRHQGSLLQNLDIRLHHAATRYLRLRWSNPDTAPWIESVSVDSQQEVYVPPVLQWSKPIAAQACSSTHCDYALPENTPIDSLRLLVSEVNTLANVTVLGQLAAIAPVSSYHHRHSPLYPLHVLRHQKRAAQVQEGRRVWLNESLVYKINLPNGEAKSPDLLMDGASYKALRLQTSGPFNMLGKTAPAIQIASLPRRLVFLARGKPPYQLQWGVENKEGAALPLTTLIPKMDVSQPVQADIASVEIADYVAPQVASKPAEKVPAKEHKPWLWAALGVGLLLLGGMVWSLLKNISEDKAKT